ncbi:unnamed protein product [Hydatigera taeniaeformis]|uniref:Secreted protein n=1 Tax=Hydatigena taeniaeformis TaxID=6205 RepID=A0A0R3XD32_HYDTA|nr:unnamed protein product [Hydatigera taeniaeformis]
MVRPLLLFASLKHLCSHLTNFGAPKPFVTVTLTYRTPNKEPIFTFAFPPTPTPFLMKVMASYGSCCVDVSDSLLRHSRRRAVCRIHADWVR